MDTKVLDKKRIGTRKVSKLKDKQNIIDRIIVSSTYNNNTQYCVAQNSSSYFVGMFSDEDSSF